MIGWALGGLVFGPIADRYGRVKTMAITILILRIFYRSLRHRHQLVGTGLLSAS